MAITNISRSVSPMYWASRGAAAPGVCTSGLLARVTPGSRTGRSESQGWCRVGSGSGSAWRQVLEGGRGGSSSAPAPRLTRPRLPSCTQDLGMGDQPLRTVLAHHELHLHRFSSSGSGSTPALSRASSASPSRDSPKTTSFDRPPGSQSHRGGRRRTQAMAAEGRPSEATRGRGGSRRVSRSEAKGSPKDLARPRSASAPEEHAGNFDAPCRLGRMVAGPPRGAEQPRLTGSGEGSFLTVMSAIRQGHDGRWASILHGE
jgi:hypothetical protein